MKGPVEGEPGLPDVQPVLEEARRTASVERRRATRQQALADAAVDLASLGSVDEVLSAVTDRARRIIRARRAATTHLSAGWEDSTTAVSSSGRDSTWRDPAAVPRGPGPLDAVIRESHPLRLNGAELARPEWAGLRADGQPPLPNYLAVPLVAVDGANLGLIQLSGKSGGRSFTEDDEAALTQLAQMAVAAMEATATLEAEREARARAEERARLRGLLADASKAFADSLEPEDTLRTLGQFIVPGLADWNAVHVPEETGEIRLAHATVGSGPNGPAVAGALDRLTVSLDQGFGPGAVMRTGRSELFRLTDQGLQSLAGGDVTVAELRVLASDTGMIVPLRARGRVLGSCWLARKGRPYSDSELAFVQDLVLRAALALDNASRYAFEREVAVTLQRSLLPQALPPSPALTTASRYLPGASGTEIGGDWYDVISLRDGRLGIVVGDVMGRGITAAAVMGQLRAAVRAYALEGHDPAGLLERTDLVVASLGEVQITTCVYGVLDPATRELEVASAGHLPPLLVEPGGGARFLVIDPNVPLGVGASRFSQATVPLPAGSTVVLYTDGLVEGRDFATDEGMARLLEAARQPVRSPDELCDRILRAMGRDGDHDDDTAILAITLGPSGPGGRPFQGRGGREIELEPVAGSAQAARDFVARALDDAGLQAQAESAVLLASELVTNSVRHAGSALTVAVAIGQAAVRVEVRDRSPRLPAMRESMLSDDEWGRGLVLVDALAARWGAERLPSGKRVWFELDLT
jgi:GAF domain-containing protein/anti-sigma regulatory factor (Ser/Thr protein kinase)